MLIVKVSIYILIVKAVYCYDCDRKAPKIRRDALNKDPDPDESIEYLIEDNPLPPEMSDRLEHLLKNISAEIVGMKQSVRAQERVGRMPEAGSTNASAEETPEAIRTRFRSLYPVDSWKENGWFEDDYLQLINVHWLKFPPQPKEMHYLLAFIYATIAFCGFIGNVLVIFMFFKCPSLRTPANILVVNLAISDFLMITEAPVFIYNALYMGPATGKIGCKLYGFVGGVTGTVSIGTLAAIAFDRYSVVVYPLEPLRNITRLRAKLSVLFVWIYGTFFALIPALDIGLGRYVPEGFLTSCSFDYLSDDHKHKVFIFAFFVAAWVLPLVIITVCYVKILRVVITTRTTPKKQGSVSTRHCKEQEKRKTELKLAGIVIGVIALFFIAWTPYALVALMGISGFKHLIYPLTSMIPAIFCKIASCIDPFVYIVTHPKFRLECENILGIKERRRKRSTMRLGLSQTNVPAPPPHGMDVTSEDDVEILEMGKVPYAQDVLMSESEGYKTPIGTISTHIKGLPIDRIPRTDEENKQYHPPSWFVKPQFAPRGSSIKRVVKTFQRMKSEDTLPT